MYQSPLASILEDFHCTLASGMSFLDQAQNRDGKNFVITGSDGYKIIMEGYVMYGGYRWLQGVIHGYFLGILDCEGLYWVIHCYMVMGGYKWLQMIMGGYWGER